MGDSESDGLKGFQRRYLRGLAHEKKPLVQVGQAGLSQAVFAAVRAALLDHELIKVRLYKPENKKRLAEQLAKKSDSHLIGVLGHTVILYRAHPEKPQIVLPQRNPAGEGQED